jgi:cytochrome b pre-mRNA-processing protein 3
MVSQPVVPLWIVLVVAMMAGTALLGWLRTRTRTARTAAELYGSIVAAARAPEHYSVLGVGDTTQGRFEMLALYVSLVLDRLAAEGSAGTRLGQALLEAFVRDVDDWVRAAGIGDAGVPRRVRKAAAALHERYAAYRAALAGEGSESLGTLLARYPYEGAPPDRAGGLEAEVRRVAAALARLSATEIAEGRIASALGPCEPGAGNDGEVP